MQKAPLLLLLVSKREADAVGPSPRELILRLPGSWVCVYVCMRGQVYMSVCARTPM